LKTKTILLALGGVVALVIGYKWFQKSRNKPSEDLMRSAQLRNQQRQIESLAKTPGGLGSAIDMAAKGLPPADQPSFAWTDFNQLRMA
jgi:hypothetical protein